MPTLPKDSNILIIAAEASSCMYAKNLIHKWNKIHPGWNFFGIGDRELQRKGMECQGLAEDLAVVGLQEVLTHWPEIKKTFNDILKACEEKQPSFAILLDYPGFNLRMAKKLKEMGIPVVYYISPQLWAWKKGRVEQIRKYVDEMLVVFPFEVDFYKDHGIEAHFVGHPLVEVIEAEKANRPRSEKTHGPATLGLMPGSRKSEIKFNLETQLQTAELLKKKSPHINVKLLLAPTLDRKSIEAQVPASMREWILFDQRPPTEMILDCDLILTASGTATLQVGLCQKPMVVMYKMNGITAFLAKLLVRSVSFFCIVNLIAGREVVPEFFQNEANPSILSKALERILFETSYCQKMLGDLMQVSKKLGSGGATENVVRFLEEKYLAGKRH